MENKKSSTDIIKNKPDNSRNDSNAGKKPPKGSVYIIILGCLAAVLSTSSTSVKNILIKDLMLLLTLILIIICIFIIRWQRNGKGSK